MKKRNIVKRFISTLVLIALVSTVFTACSKPTTTKEETTEPTSVETPAPAAQVPISQPYDGLRVMIVGSGSPQFEVDRGQPSTLVQYKDKYFLIDCGNRTSDTLAANGVPAKRITNILLTHQHFDHNGDFWDVFMSGSVVPNGRPTLTLVGPDVKTLLDTTLNYYKADIDMRVKGLKLTNDAAIYGTKVIEITENTTFELDGVKITTMLLPHGLTNYAYKFEADGQTVVVSGDFLNIPELADFAKGADIFVADAMLTSTFSYIPNEEIRAGLKKSLENSHASGEQVIDIIANSQAKKAVLTHLGGDSGIEETSKLIKDKGYTGEIIDAKDGLIIEP